MELKKNLVEVFGLPILFAGIVMSITLLGNCSEDVKPVLTGPSDIARQDSTAKADSIAKLYQSIVDTTVIDTAR